MKEASPTKTICFFNSNKAWGGGEKWHFTTAKEFQPIEEFRLDEHIVYTIPVGSNPNQIAVSNDGSTAYVGIDGATSVRKVNLNTRTAEDTIPLEYDSVFGAGTANALSIAVNPANSNEIAVCLQNSGSSAFGGPVVFRNGVQIGPMPEIYTASQAVYVDTANLVGANIGLSPTSIYQVGIGLNDLTVNNTIQTGFPRPTLCQRSTSRPMAGRSMPVPRTG